MSEMPLVSVVMPVYNAEKFIYDALISILNQTYKNLDIIIIDDCSSDSSIEIINKIKDSRVRLIHNKVNLGVAGSLNKGFELACGKYIARMDSDDIAELTRIEMQVNYLEKNEEVGVCGTGIRFIGDAEGEKLFSLRNDKITVDLLFQCSLCHPTVMLRKEIIDKYCLKYEKEFEKAEDYRLWCKISKYTKIQNLNCVGLNYRVHLSQVSELYKQTQLCVSNKIRKDFLLDNNVSLAEDEINIFNKACNDMLVTSQEYAKLIKIFRKIILKLKKNKNFSHSYLIYVSSTVLNRSLNKMRLNNYKGYNYIWFKINNLIRVMIGIVAFKISRKY